MKRIEKDNLIFFGEYAPYNEAEPESRAKATLWLKQWKEYQLQKLSAELHDYEPYDGTIVDGDKMKQDPDGWYEHWVDRPPLYSGIFELHSTLALKFCMKKKLPNQL